MIGQWEQERRPELRLLFQHYMYGYVPRPPSNVRAVVDRVEQGRGTPSPARSTTKEIRVTYGPPGTPVIHLLLIVPRNRTGPAPVFVGLNFMGNDSGQTLHQDYPIETIVERGYAVATAASGDIFPDRPDFASGILRQITDRFPYWFNRVFSRFGDATDRLPFDRHSLVGLVAPRPVLFSNGIEDHWADPRGQFEVLWAADPIYRLLGVRGLDASEMPPARQLTGGTLGYRLREGGHGRDRQDWKIFLDFADMHSGNSRRRWSRTCEPHPP
jgi:hypothetical protein